MIIVRQRDVAVHDETWIAQVDALASAAQGWTGNDTQVLELSEDKVATALQRSNAIIRELRGAPSGSTVRRRLRGACPNRGVWCHLLRRPVFTHGARTMVRLSKCCGQRVSEGAQAVQWLRRLLDLKRLPLRRAVREPGLSMR